MEPKEGEATAPGDWRPVGGVNTQPGQRWVVMVAGKQSSSAGWGWGGSPGQADTCTSCRGHRLAAQEGPGLGEVRVPPVWDGGFRRGSRELCCGTSPAWSLG